MRVVVAVSVLLALSWAAAASGVESFDDPTDAAFVDVSDMDWATVGRQCGTEDLPADEEEKEDQIVAAADSFLKGNGAAIVALKAAYSKKATALRFQASGGKNRLRGSSYVENVFSIIERILPHLRNLAEVLHVPVKVHVVTKAKSGCSDQNVEDSSFCCKDCEGYVSMATVKKQMDVLNKRFKVGSFSVVFFTLEQVRYTAKTSWFNARYKSGDERAMKTALGSDHDSHLNMYLTSGGGLLGWATWPYKLWLANLLPSFYGANKKMDGVVVAHHSLPGGTSPYDLGLTAVHEIGHWLSLRHVFQQTPKNSGCDASNNKGDFVDDTPLQITATSGCPRTQDSCPSVPGKDSIHSLMDYSDDACMTDDFTKGQIARMKAAFVFRPKLDVRPKGEVLKECKKAGTCW